MQNELEKIIEIDEKSEAKDKIELREKIAIVAGYLGGAACMFAAFNIYNEPIYGMAGAILYGISVCGIVKHSGILNSIEDEAKYYLKANKAKLEE